jgi:hypothetical protein
MLCLSYYCLCLFFNKTGEKGRTGSTWKRGGSGEEKGVGGGGRNGPNNYAHMNKEKIKSEKNKNKTIGRWMKNPFITFFPNTPLLPALPSLTSLEPRTNILSRQSVF